MKTRITFLLILVFTGIISSCTPNAIADNDASQKVPNVYGWGGEHSVEPDNEKD